MTKRTVTLTTLDAGEVTLPEPSWCGGHSDHVPQYRADLTHYGPEHTLAFRGEDLFVFMLAESPFSQATSRDTCLYVEQSGYAHSHDPAELDALADALVRHAAVLRHQARGLAALLAGGDR